MSYILEKKCLECGHQFHGRIDKKFCSDQCRSAHNNRLNMVSSGYIKRVNYILKRNRRILTELNPDGKNKVYAEKLKVKGFDFNYFTSVYTHKNGDQYYYCYDQGYAPIDRDYYLLVAKKEV